MKSSVRSRQEKTNVAVKTSATFNSPGNYIAPYGKTAVRIGGRGASGNATTGGNYAGEEYDYTNPTTYQYAGTNPATYQYAGTNPGTVVGTLYQWFNNSQYTTYNTYPGYDASITPPYSNSYTGHQVQYGAYYNPGNDYYNTVPGNDYYNTVPGNDVYSPYYNPTVPGNAGAAANIGGVYFPGGAAGSVAPVVPLTTTAISYSASGLSITVPTGGYVTVDNI